MWVLNFPWLLALTTFPLIDSKNNTSHKNVEEEKSDDVKGPEASAIMLTLLAECSENKDVWKLHDLMGHSNFVALILNDDEVAAVKKVHRYFGHRSPRKVWEMFATSGKLREKKQSVVDLLENCTVCRKLKKTLPKPKVGMPVANNFNEVIRIDLKVLENGKYILWMVDMFTKAIKGKYITN